MMLKSPRLTLAPTTVPVLFFFFDGGLLLTVGIKPEHVKIRHYGEDRKKELASCCDTWFGTDGWY